MAAEQHDYAELQTETKLKDLGQRLVTLSVANRETLLSIASREANRRRDEAAAVLDRLQQLNPTVASYFSPKSYAISELPLRMICTQELDSVESFIVVSYSWHCPSWKLADGAKPIAPGWAISQPMVDAIMGHRQNEQEAVWLDRLCIDQNDERDKELHIGTMDLVYRSARRVIILFEDIELTKEEGDAGVTYAAFYRDLCDQVSDRNLEGKERSDFINSYFPSREKEYREQGKGHLVQDIRPFLLKMLSSRWYTRAWCAHESRVVRHSRVNNPLILCFDHQGQVLSFEFSFIFLLANIFANMELMAKNDFLHALDSNPTGLQQLRIRMQRLFHLDNENASAMEHLASVIQFGCLHKGDLISIALNTSGIPLIFSGQHNVKTDEDTIWLFSVLTLAAGDVQPLIFEGERLRFANPDGSQAASWMSHPREYFHGDRLCTPLAHSITEIKRDYIELDLLIFPTLTSEPSPAAQETALKMVETYHLLDLAMELMCPPDVDVSGERAIERYIREQVYLLQGQRIDRTSLAKFLCAWLACGIHNGLDWMTGFPERIRRSTEARERQLETGTLGIARDERLVDAAAAILDYFGAEGRAFTNPVTPGSDTKTLIGQLTKFLTTILDPRIGGLSNHPQLLPFTATSVQMVDCAITSSSFSRSWIAVPAALAHLTAWRKRAWVVEPFDLQDTSDNTGGRLRGLRQEFVQGQKWVDAYPFLRHDGTKSRLAIGGEGSRVGWRMWGNREICGCEDLGSYCEMLAKNGNDAGDASMIEAAEGSVVLLRKQRVYGSVELDYQRIKRIAEDFRKAIAENEEEAR
ncbi:hypothetical protein QBC34DRAFT_355891 [Podospora aff. communis PSN243]|uniref:Heterokaryon incompatibility domain-containing protein n=1 Tax=Podospora aff. communis PSN243 TaxID=3040156 RepID=A0AAV9GFQ5_9PEZI|nr:hypothetical protein QBC34DRAFT_355891 [Podospora aff. communis PSN243]